MYWTPHQPPQARPNSRLRRFASVQRIVGLLLMIFSLTMLPPILVALLYGDGTVGAFLGGTWITFVTGIILWWPVRAMDSDLKTRDGFLITVLFWAVLGLFGAIPLYFAAEAWPSYTDAIFESVSGLTTTGATTLPSGIDALPRSLNYYRAQLHWFGGMGIIVLAVAVLPMLGVGGMQLYKAETPGPIKDAKLTPRITETARVLWIVYAALTAACALAYWACGMSAFDAVCHAFSTLSAGGFSTHDASIGYFQSLPIELVSMVFMLVAASNFALHFRAWQRRSLSVYPGDAEFRTMLMVLLVFGILICIPLWWSGVYESPGMAVRRGMFQLVAYATTAGFATADPTHWPGYVPLLLVLSTFMICSAGSTGGGIKMLRMILFVKQALREMQKLVHPSAEVSIKFGNRVVPGAVLSAVSGFVAVYVALYLALSFAFVSTGEEPVAAFSIVAACINNAGPGLGSFNAHVAAASSIGKWILIVAMLLGRLEVFTLLVIFTPAFWRR